MTGYTRRWRWPGGVIGGIAATEFVPGVAVAAHQIRVLRAEQFELVDGSGSKRAVLEVTARGIADLVMIDGRGRERAAFRVAREGGASVGFMTSTAPLGCLSARANQGRNGTANYGSNGEQLAGLTVAPEDQGSLTLYDPNSGRARAGLGVGAKGSPDLALFDQSGRDRAELHVTANGTPGLALANEGGKTTEDCC